MSSKSALETKYGGKHDAVEHPAHYNMGKIEVIEAIEDWQLSFHRGQVVKYVARAGRKNPEKELEDLQKARWYLDREIARLGGPSLQAPNVVEKTVERQLAEAAIKRLRETPANVFHDAFKGAPRADIEKAITDLLIRGIDMTEGPRAIFTEHTKVVHRTGATGRVCMLDWDGGLNVPGSTRHEHESGGRSFGGPVCVEWDSEGPDFGRKVSWHKPEDLALPSNPVPVSIGDLAPSRAYPVPPQDSTTAVAGDSPEAQG